MNKRRAIGGFVICAVLSVAFGCGKSFFPGQVFGTGGDDAEPTPPTPITSNPPLPPTITCCDPPPPPTPQPPNEPPTTITKMLAQNVSDFVFSGDGPGSCGLVDGCVPGAPACPAGFVATGELQGDCFLIPDSKRVAEWSRDKWPFDHLCHGNRRICKKMDTAKTGITTTDLNFSEAKCKSGYAPTGPANTKHHVLTTSVIEGVATKRTTKLTDFHLCKTTKMVEALKPGDRIVTDFKFYNPGERLAAVTPCPKNDPAGKFLWEQDIVIADCVKHKNPQHPSIENGVCTGKLTVCKRYDLVPENF